MTVWPAPIIPIFLGRMTPAAALVAADDPDANKKAGLVCEANFCAGELARRTGRKDEATRLFQLAPSDCLKGFVEFADKAKLKALGGAP